MKVFISWSGPTSRAMAQYLREWLPLVIQTIEPFMSDEDVYKGARWANDISAALEGTDFGILCVLRSNTASPWLNFEAGALSKSIGTSRVIPLLFDLKPAEMSGPLVQFQATTCDRGEIRKLVDSLNQAEDKPFLDDRRLTRLFDQFWPDMESNLASLREEMARLGEQKQIAGPTLEQMVQETLELVRAQQRLLSDREDATRMLSPDELRALLGLADAITYRTGEGVPHRESSLGRATISLGTDAGREGVLRAEDLPRQLVVGNWSAIVSTATSLNRSIGALLRYSKAVADSESGIVIMCRFPFHRDRLNDERSRHVIRRAIRSAVGSDVPFVIGVDRGDSSG